MLIYPMYVKEKEEQRVTWRVFAPLMWRTKESFTKKKKAGKRKGEPFPFCW